MFVNLTPGNWVYWLEGGLVLRLGGAIWCSFAFWILVKEQYWLIMAFCLVFVLVGLALCFNSVLDLISGPQLLEARVTDVKVWNEVRRRYGSSSKTVSVRFEETTYARIHLKAQGKEQQITISSDYEKFDLWVEAFKHCYQTNGVARVVLLRHLDIILGVECS